jgi:hypothetical protein
VHVRPSGYEALISQADQLITVFASAVVTNVVVKPVLRERARLGYEQLKRESEGPSRLDCFTSLSMFGECAGNGSRASARFAYDLLPTTLKMVLGMADDSGGKSQIGYVHPFEAWFNNDGPIVNLETGEGYENLAVLGDRGFKPPRLYTKQTKLEEARRRGGRCEYCGVKLDLEKPNTPESMRGDHVVPYWLHPETKRENLVIACRTCNLQKAGKTIGPGPEEFWPRIWGKRPLIKK